MVIKMKEEEMNATKSKDILESVEAKVIKDYFAGHDWEERTCAHCSSQYLTKPRNTTDACGRSDCSTLDFLDRPKRKRFLNTSDFVDRFEEYFSGEGYIKSEPVDIVNGIGSTLFAGTAGQIFDKEIFLEKELDKTPRFVAQPVIRLQGRPFVGQKEGFSTSFVNVALEHLDP